MSSRIPGSSSYNFRLAIHRFYLSPDIKPINDNVFSYFRDRSIEKWQKSHGKKDKLIVFGIKFIRANNLIIRIEIHAYVTDFPSNF